MTAVKEENKYLVLKWDDIEKYLSSEYTNKLQDVCIKIQLEREADEKLGTNKYIVVNQDEPYAEEVWQTVLHGEEAKKQLSKNILEPEKDI